MATLLTGLVVAAGAASAQGHRDDRPDFATLDANGDGALSLEELQAHGEARFADVDTNADGGLSADELIAAAEARAAERVEGMIARLDENGDGVLQIEEMPRRGGERAERMFSHLDADDDGLISEEEFAAAKERRGDRGKGHGHGPRGRG